MIRKTLTLLSLYLCVMTFGFAEIIPLEKIYIDSSQIVVDSGEIFVAHEGAVQPVGCIAKDEHGLFFTPQAAACINTPKAWTCSVCGYPNGFWRTGCIRCGNGDPYPEFTWFQLD